MYRGIGSKGEDHAPAGLFQFLWIDTLFDRKMGFGIAPLPTPQLFQVLLVEDLPACHPGDRLNWHRRDIIFAGRAIDSVKCQKVIGTAHHAPSERLPTYAAGD